MIVDSREYEEYKISRIPNAVFRSEFLKVLSKQIDQLQKITIVIYDSIGVRAAFFIKKVISTYQNYLLPIFLLKGGILEWTYYSYLENPINLEKTKRINCFGPSWKLAEKSYKMCFFASSKRAFLTMKAINDPLDAFKEIKYTNSFQMIQNEEVNHYKPLTYKSKQINSYSILENSSKQKRKYMKSTYLNQKVEGDKQRKKIPKSRFSQKFN